MTEPRSKRTISIRVVPMLITTGIFALVLAVSLILDVSQNAAIKRIESGTKRIEERVVKPICVTMGERDTCLAYLRGADPERVIRLCRDTAKIAREAGIEVRCMVVTKRSANRGQADSTKAPDREIGGGRLQSGSAPGQRPGPPPGGPPQGSPPGGAPGSPGGSPLDQALDNLNETVDQAHQGVCHTGHAAGVNAPTC